MTPPLGSLRDRLELQRRESSRMPDGGHEVLFVPLATVWGRVRMRNARVSRDGDGRTASASHAVTLRWRGDLGPGDRIVHRGKRLEILAAENEDGRRAYLVCLCVETTVLG